MAAPMSTRNASGLKVRVRREPHALIHRISIAILAEIAPTISGHDADHWIRDAPGRPRSLYQPSDFMGALPAPPEDGRQLSIVLAGK